MLLLFFFFLKMLLKAEKALYKKILGNTFNFSLYLNLKTIRKTREILDKIIHVFTWLVRQLFGCKDLYEVLG